MKYYNRELLAIKNIYEKSFPKDERRTFENLTEIFRTNRNVRLNIKRDGDSVIGFIIYWLLSDFTYIEHFAIDDIYRSKGLGTDFLKSLLERVSLPIVIEVEPPQDEFSKKRIHFYERMGFVLHNYNYIQPAYSKDKQPLEMKLMTLGYNNFKDEEVKTSLYKNIYNV